MNDSGITAEVILLTPEIASELLKNLPPHVELADGTFQQRPYRQGTVDHYARELTSGIWKENNQTIGVSPEGWMVDGQHRCRAVVQTGIPMTVVMVRGVKLSAIDTIDRGAKRTISDVFAMAGMTVRVARTAGAAARMEYDFRRAGNPFLYSSASAPAASELLAIASNNNEFIQACEWAEENCCRLGNLFNRSHIAFLLFRSGLKDPLNASKDFYDGLVNGVGLSENDPRIWIRNKVMRESIGRLRTSPQYKSGLIVKAWNRYRDGKEIISEGNFLRLNVEYEFKQLRTLEEDVKK
jgi:hypothetical protein